jgi:uncharacterized membrane protein YqaE (UPF0057 family)
MGKFFLVNKIEALEDLVSFGVFLEPLYGFVHEVIINIATIILLYFLALFHLETQANYLLGID